MPNWNLHFRFENLCISNVHHNGINIFRWHEAFKVFRIDDLVSIHHVICYIHRSQYNESTWNCIKYQKHVHVSKWSTHTLTHSLFQTAHSLFTSWQFSLKKKYSLRIRNSRIVGMVTTCALSTASSSEHLFFSCVCLQRLSIPEFVVSLIYYMLRFFAAPLRTSAGASQL